jgi:hypothetical protein
VRAINRHGIVFVPHESTATRAEHTNGLPVLWGSSPSGERLRLSSFLVLAAQSPRPDSWACWKFAILVYLGARRVPGSTFTVTR